MLAVTLVSAINPSLDLGSLAESVKKLVIWVLGIVMTLFTGLLSIQSFAGAAADNLSARAVKFAASSFIPVIGGSISEAYSAVPVDAASETGYAASVGNTSMSL